MDLNVQTMSIDQLLEEFRTVCYRLGARQSTSATEPNPALERRANELEQELLRRAAW